MTGYPALPSAAGELIIAWPSSLSSVTRMNALITTQQCNVFHLMFQCILRSANDILACGASKSNTIACAVITATDGCRDVVVYEFVRYSVLSSGESFRSHVDPLDTEGTVLAKCPSTTCSMLAILAACSRSSVISCRYRRRA